MEERTNKHGLRLARGVSREKFWYFSVAIASVYLDEISTQLPGTLTHPLALSDRASGFTGHNKSLQQPLLSNIHLSMTVANSHLFTALRHYLLPVSLEILYASSLCGFRAKTDKGIL